MTLPTLFSVLSRNASLLARDAREVRIATAVVNIVASDCGLSPERLARPNGAKRGAAAGGRALALYLLVMAGNLNRREAGRQMGVTRHAIIQAIGAVERRRQTDAVFDRRLDELELAVMEALECPVASGTLMVASDCRSGSRPEATKGAPSPAAGARNACRRRPRLLETA